MFVLCLLAAMAPKREPSQLLPDPASPQGESTFADDLRSKTAARGNTPIGEVVDKIKKCCSQAADQGLCLCHGTVSPFVGNLEPIRVELELLGLTGRLINIFI